MHALCKAEMSTYGRQQRSGCRQTCVCCANNCTPGKNIPPIGPSPVFTGTILWWLLHLSRVAQVSTAELEHLFLSSELQVRDQTSDAASPPAAQLLGSTCVPAPASEQHRRKAALKKCGVMNFRLQTSF